jgi:hypothetical protein
MVQAAGTQSTLNITMDVWHQVGASGEPAFQNSWSNMDGPAPAGRYARFRKYPDGRVRLAGVIKTGTLGQAAFTLPVGYRPAIDHTFPADQNSAFGTMSIGANGWVLINTNNAFAFLDGIEFDTESVLQTASVAAQPLDTWHLIGGAGEPPFQNSFTNYGGGNESVGFRKYPDGRVRLKGFLRAGTVNTTAFTLPSGYRPPTQRRYACPGHTGSAYVISDVEIGSDGALSIPAAYGSLTSGTGYVDLAVIEFDTETVAAYASGFLGPPRVTALPANPVDSQECYFVADAANGILWHLRYNTGSASAYKWEVVGGNPLSAIATSGVNLAAQNTWSDLSGSPSFVAPLAGDYLVGHGCNIANQSGTPTATNCHAGVFVVSGVPVEPYCSGVTGDAYARSQSTDNGKITVVSGAVIKQQFYQGSTNPIAYSRRWMKLMPVRVG